MKKVLFPVFAIVAALIIFVACSKSDSSSSTPEEDNTITKEYFEVTDATYVPQAFPEATSDRTIEVSMNNNVISGGSNYVTVTSEVPARKIYVGLDGEDGYYEFIPETADTKDGGYTYEVIMIIDQELTDDDFTVIIAILDEEGNISSTYETNIALIEAGTGGLQISLSFDNDKDVDLHLLEPGFEEGEGEHIYYGNRQSLNGGWLDLDSNPACNIDHVNNENIFYNDSTAYIKPGLYKVYAVMWSNCDPSIATNYIVTVFYNGQLINTTTGDNPAVGTFPVGAPSTGSSLYGIEPVCTFYIPDNGQTPPAKSQKKLPAFLRSQNK